MHNFEHIRQGFDETSLSGLLVLLLISYSHPAWFNFGGIFDHA